VPDQAVSLSMCIYESIVPFCLLMTWRWNWSQLITTRSTWHWWHWEGHWVKGQGQPAHKYAYTCISYSLAIWV